MAKVFSFSISLWEWVSIFALLEARIANDTNTLETVFSYHFFAGKYIKKNPMKTDSNYNNIYNLCSKNLPEKSRCEKTGFDLFCFLSNTTI